MARPNPINRQLAREHWGEVEQEADRGIEAVHALQTVARELDRLAHPYPEVYAAVWGACLGHILEALEAIKTNAAEHLEELAWTADTDRRALMV
jgi:hypothetical protein